MNRTLTRELNDLIGQKVRLEGWVGARRDHGKLIFIDLRDRWGIAQCVIEPQSAAYENAIGLRSEYVIGVTGIVKERPQGMINDKIISGKIEISVEQIELINESKTLPFELDKDTIEVDEEVRMKYRYLDLRSARLQKNIIARDGITAFIREYMRRHDFLEIETPYITKGTPEGAREFTIPARLYPGNFYVLPQSPQQFKQLLMVAGFERYFQIARCFRDEDPRGDRQAEFTQLDLEMSFVTQEQVWEIIEGLMIEMIQKLYPTKKIARIPFPRITYREAMEKYGSDKPDLRVDPNNPDELAFAWIIDFPMFEKTRDGRIKTSHHPFTMPNKDDWDKLETDPLAVRAYSYDLVLNGSEISSGSIRIHKREIQNKIFKILQLSDQEIESRFGHLLTAFEYGAPPHGGAAPGIDRLVMILENEPNIREVMAFPKTGDSRDLMMGAPSPLPEEKLDELHIQVKGKDALEVIKKAQEQKDIVA